jgi:hypothetical protein
MNLYLSFSLIQCVFCFRFSYIDKRYFSYLQTCRSFLESFVIQNLHCVGLLVDIRVFPIAVTIFFSCIPAKVELLV